ncbi:hypothetical protein TVAG_103930 [Trichomonas vaginalis G3]|uniref:Uncharacterized protein n=1 Tax=Trichomonas vaginalis (strain ATCC PRA-98 / G3) TaxID=412133 RepID=A2FN32_TRIV3|nr:hypothetical protein TVAGG3_0044030 [Trichomonas vaginalis G3]EAX93674.1 hypothetical protein TVAG_103930 [Trichomonas vaginalis G3]KAI5540905.1 hypothetical protein TVAGG3_0044030 [Trichomonas vaginalis G3]|eukprot:XP_001306604.1 hypothetical protein [Trichomonas vaginalis G3]
MNAFLSSLERSFTKFSQSADEKRLQLSIIDQQFKDLDKEVKKQLNETPKLVSRTAPQTKASSRPRTIQRARTAVKRGPRKSAKEDPVIRPAPYPVKNYILPAQPVYGAARYYKPAAKEHLRKEELLERLEREKYPDTIDDPTPRDLGPDLVVTSKSYSVGKKGETNSIDDYFNAV